MKKEYTTNLLKIISFLFPFGIGVYGYFVIGNETFLNSAFYTVMMYTINYDEIPPNIFVEIARWTAPVATAGGVLFIFINFHTHISNRIKYLRGHSVAVYGEEKNIEPVLKELGKNGIKGTSGNLISADRYIFMYENEEDNFNFYQQYRNQLAYKPTYLKCNSLRPQSIETHQLKLFHFEEAKARTYWKQYSLYEMAKSLDYKLQIFIIGFPRLGRDLLLFGLQSNIFSPDQCIEYHIFGADDGFHFQSLYKNLDKIGDPVIFHDDEWYRSPELLEEADRIIVCDETNPTALLNDILLLVPEKRVDVFSNQKELLEMFFSNTDIVFHHPYDEGEKLSNILSDELFEQAKQINLNYAVLYDGIEKNDKNKEAEWQKLDTFTRYSNISAADYHEIRLQMLRSLTGKEVLSKEDYIPYLELFAELEHIRWCRYHYLNNWTYGIPANGKNKDASLRIHKCLLPYHELPEKERQKDCETIQLMFEKFF